jgi:hypothetical protein
VPVSIVRPALSFRATRVPFGVAAVAQVTICGVDGTDVAVVVEPRSKVRTAVLALTLLPGLALGIDYLLEPAAGAASWIVVCVRLIGFLLIAVTSTGAWKLVKRRSVARFFIAYGTLMLGLVVAAFVLVANGHRG